MLDNNLKYAREDLEMTQEELGYVFGVKKATISNWENGYDIIPLNKLVKFCNLYNYSFDFIVGFTRENKIYPKLNKIDKIKIGKNLKDLRNRLNLTQQQIADECSISRATFCHYELGMNLISTLTLYTICKNHKISMDSFLRQ
jgi:DNA-binding helix-turn-helix protein